MSVSEEDALKLVAMAYDAALDGQRWPTFLEAFAGAVGGCSSLLRSVNISNNASGFVSSFGYDSAWQAAYCSHYVKVDYLTRALNQFGVGEVKTSDQGFMMHQQRKTELFSDYLKPQDKLHAMGVFLVKNCNETLMFSAQRGQHAGEFGDEAIRLMRLVAPHVSRVVHIHQKVQALTAERVQAQGALDQLRMGVILVNRLGVPLYLNRAAELMMSQAVGLGMFHNRLAVHSASETAHLLKLIANASQGGCNTAVGGDMRITLPNKTDFLHCIVAPISPEISDSLNIACGADCVALFLTQPGNLQLSPKRLVTLYKITPAEARLAARLASLRTVEEASDDLGVSVSTARSQLKSVFNKTGVQSQAELLMLLATGTLAQCIDE